MRLIDDVVEELRRSGKERITLGYPSDGWAWIGKHRVSLFPKGQRIMGKDHDDGAETHWRVLDHDLDGGVLIVERWT